MRALRCNSRPYFSLLSSITHAHTFHCSLPSSTPMIYRACRRCTASASCTPPQRALWCAHSSNTHARALHHSQEAHNERPLRTTSVGAVLREGGGKRSEDRGRPKTGSSAQLLLPGRSNSFVTMRSGGGSDLGDAWHLPPSSPESTTSSTEVRHGCVTLAAR